MEYCLVGENIEKSYGTKHVLNALNVHVPKGSIYGLIGPNGAGKSTFLKGIMKLISFDAGTVCVLGNKNGMTENELSRTGSLIEYPYFYNGLSGFENLSIHSKYMGIYDEKRIEEVLAEVGLSSASKEKVSNYSMGMRQRLAIARAMLIKPELLILDEPTNALDPNGIKDMRELFIRLNKEYNTTILISSHILSEMDQLATHVGIMKQGRMLLEKTLAEIYEENKGSIRIKVDDTSRAIQILRSNGMTDIKVTEDEEVELADAELDTSVLSKIIVENNLRLYKIDSVNHTLEDYFFKVVGNV